MANPQQLSFIKAPVVDSSGKLTWPIMKWVQDVDTRVQASLDLLGINPEATVSATATPTPGTIGATLQNINPQTGKVSSSGVGFSLSDIPGQAGASQVGFTLDSVPDGTKRFAIINAAGLNGVAQVDGANLAIINFASAHLNKILDNVNDGVNFQRFKRVGSGQAALGTGLIGAGGNNVVTAQVLGVLSSDTVVWSFAGAPPAAYLSGSINVLVYVTANNVNFVQVNPTAGNVTPGAVSVNFQVIR